MFAKLTALAGLGGFVLPYNLEEPYVYAWGSWTHHPGTVKEDGSRVSIFKTWAADPNDRKLVIARNGVKRLRMLRHPNVLSFRDSVEANEKGMTVIYLVTEPVRPIKLVMEELALTGQQRDDYLAMGFLHITNAVSFLNNSCKLIHGNVCLSALVVTDSLDWKLHGFDLLSEHSLPPDNCLQHSVWMVGNQYKPAELGKSEWDVIRQAPPCAVDAWGLGCLMQEVFSCEDMQSVDNLRRTDVIPPALLQDYQKLLSSAPARRLNPSKVAESKFLNNRLVDVVAFMENVAVKDAMDKETFFKRLPAILPAMPVAVSIRKILPLLSSALEFGGAPPVAVSSLMLIGSHLDTDEFNKRVVPCLTKLFASTDRGLRRSLLETLDTYAAHLTSPVIEEQIFPQLQSGFSDGHAYIRELTLKSILTLAPRMSSKTLTHHVLKHLSKLQVDEEPSIRANTTVLLGNIASYLGEATCKRVLLNAFARALKDSFPPARIAGLRALVATKQYYTSEDAALRILPVVAPLCIDGAGEVRSAGLQCMETFTKALKEADAQRTAELAASTDGAISGGAGGAPQMGAGSMLTWAVSGLLSTVSAAGAAAGNSKPAVPAGRVSSSSGGEALLSGASAAAAAKVKQPASSTTGASSACAPPTVSPTSISATAGVSASSSTNGWDEGDGWNDEALEVDEAEIAARSRLSSKPKSSASTMPAAPAARVQNHVALPIDDNPWEALEQAVQPVVPRKTPTIRPPGTAGASGTVKKAAGGMKLGAQKLGATKAAIPDLL